MRGKIAVISHGPSANSFEDDGSYLLKIGVNSIAERLLLNWWVFIDAPVFGKYSPLGDPEIFCCDSAILAPGLIDMRPHVFSGSPLLYDHLWMTGNYWSHKSGLAAIRLAAMLANAMLCRAGERCDVHLFGYDMTGSDDVNGGHTGTRSDARWKMERKHFDNLTMESTRDSRGLIQFILETP